MIIKPYNQPLKAMTEESRLVSMISQDREIIGVEEFSTGNRQGSEGKD
jgi:hypothetical protein